MSGENGDPEVLRSLPRTRPARRSTKRAAAAGTGAEAKAPDAVAPPKAGAPKPKPKPKPKAARKTAPKAAAKPAAGATTGKAGDLPPAGWASPADKDEAGSGGIDVIGAATGLVGAVLRRLPRP